MNLVKYKTWGAYQSVFKLASRIFRLSMQFPKSETYSLTDQIRRSSRSVCANLAESYGHRCYSASFKHKLTICIGENLETMTWLDFALDCQYIDQHTYDELDELAQSTSKLLYYMIANPKKF
ncbi:diversity-generating retroelement protein bAvd family protein [Lewinellaceae bacterium SD302]|nr:diversity-generating retroelement protein bAvd family protein [Lewinellaceae bacterium SD302]